MTQLAGVVEPDNYDNSSIPFNVPLSHSDSNEIENDNINNNTILWESLIFSLIATPIIVGIAIYIQDNCNSGYVIIPEDVAIPGALQEAVNVFPSTVIGGSIWHMV